MSPPLDSVAAWRPKLPPGMQAVSHLSRLAWRWLLHSDLRAAQQKATEAGRVMPIALGAEALDQIMARQDRTIAVGGDLMPAPRQRWPDVPRAVAQAIAMEHMRAEPDEASRFAEMSRDHKIAISDAERRGQRAAQAEQVKAKREKSVFLTRFFPVPAPGCWTLETWTRAQVMQIGSKLAAALAAMEHTAEPAWFPCGWRESMIFFGHGGS